LGANLKKSMNAQPPNADKTEFIPILTLVGSFRATTNIHRSKEQ
jgi:hypothetical protein